MSALIRDDFAGPGGWDEGLRILGIHDRILGFDTDGDKTPAAFTTLGYAQLGRTLIEVATDARACYDEALDAMPDEPRRVEPDTAFIDPDEWAERLETARRKQTLHDLCGPDEAVL